ncbi:uncharacterized protein LOC105855380 [Microcebus murinus]|uniref:uncharacterized protein LOC105855380 n=1 Tax=Microcebus murinus TaxID=30608 RepID=UPI003F6D6C0E
MATPAALRSLEEEVTCSICLDHLRDPVAAECGRVLCRLGAARALRVAVQEGARPPRVAAGQPGGEHRAAEGARGPAREPQGARARGCCAAVRASRAPAPAAVLVEKAAQPCQEKILNHRSALRRDREKIQGFQAKGEADILAAPVSTAAGRTGRLPVQSRQSRGESAAASSVPRATARGRTRSGWQWPPQLCASELCGLGPVSHLRGERAAWMTARVPSLLCDCHLRCRVGVRQLLLFRQVAEEAWLHSSRREGRKTRFPEGRGKPQRLARGSWLRMKLQDQRRHIVAESAQDHQFLREQEQHLPDQLAELKAMGSSPGWPWPSPSWRARRSSRGRAPIDERRSRAAGASLTFMCRTLESLSLEASVFSSEIWKW